MQEDMKNDSLSDEAIKKASKMLNIGEKECLYISQAQKQIESFIAIQDAIKSKVAPVIASMQFEDLMQQRIEHLEAGYQKVIELDGNCSEEVVSEVIDFLESLLCASKEETK